MELQFTPEQEARLEQIAAARGLAPSRLVVNAVMRLIEDEARGAAGEEDRQSICPECGYRFGGGGYEGIDAHWRSRRQSIMKYEDSWPLIRSGVYESRREDLEDLRIAEERLANLRAGRSTTHSLNDVERELGLVD